MKLQKYILEFIILVRLDSEW